jgi:hypothetical protein
MPGAVPVRYSGFMAANALGTRNRSTWRILLALACVLLVVVAGTVQVAHTHADGTDTHADCSLCAAAHITVHLVQTPIPAPAAVVVNMREALLPAILPNTLIPFALFIRPPPVAAVPA